MRISDQQALAMFLILKESCAISGGFFSLTQKARLALVNDILHQQPTTLRLEEVPDEPESVPDITSTLTGSTGR